MTAGVLEAAWRIGQFARSSAGTGRATYKIWSEGHAARTGCFGGSCKGFSAC